MLRKIWRNPQAVIGLGLIVLICAVAILAPLLAPHAPDEVNPLMKYQAPSADYPLGTDQLGQCELSRLLYGARASLGAGASHFDSVGRDWFNPWNDDSVYRRLV